MAVARFRVIAAQEKFGDVMNILSKTLVWAAILSTISVPASPQVIGNGDRNEGPILGVKIGENEIPDSPEEADRKAKLPSCKDDPMLVLGGKVSPRTFFAIAQFKSDQERNNLFLDDRYVVLQCEGRLSNTQSEPSIPNVGLPPLPGLPSESVIIGQPLSMGPQPLSSITDKFLGSKKPDLQSGYSDNELNNRLIEFCEDPRKAELVTLPATPECKRAAEFMDALGLGSEALGVRADLEKTQSIREDIRKAVEEGSPKASGAAIVLAAAGVAIAGYSVYQHIRDRAEKDAASRRQRTASINQISGLSNRKSELENDIRAMREIDGSSDNSDLVKGLQAQNVVSEKTREDALRQGADGLKAIEDYATKALEKKTDEITNEQGKVRDIEAALGCTGPECDASCAEMACVDFAISKVFDPAAEAIAQCEAQQNLVRPVTPGEAAFETLLLKETPKCEPLFVDDPCYRLSPDGCGDQFSPEEQKRQIAADLTRRTAVNIHCSADDVACNQTVDAMLRQAAGLKPEGAMHDLTCGNYERTFPDFSLPALGPVGDIQIEDDDPECLNFLGARKCGIEKGCYLAATSSISAANSLGLSIKSETDYLKFLIKNPECRIFSRDLLTYWMGYSIFLTDVNRFNRRADLIEAGRAVDRTPLSFDIITRKKDFDPTSLKNRRVTIPGQPHVIVDPGIGSEEYYRANFCD